MNSRTSILAALVLVLVAGATSAFAQTQIQFVEYSAKFLCGVEEGKQPGSGPVRPGIYETTINIHNPQLPLNPLPSVTFAKKVVLSTPEGEKPVPPSRFRVDRVQADFAEQVDCKIIREMLGPAGTAPFIEGFVVLIIPSRVNPAPQLDVVGVYTVDSPTQSMALEMVPIAPRILTLPTAAGTRLQKQMMEQPKQ
ncbi:MAG TPA: hypothetical protein VKH81_07990 [Candidatus Angelobacter sp.]|nr:hypothetical protein [Candidatus Angelobacter sp.]